MNHPRGGSSRGRRLHVPPRQSIGAVIDDVRDSIGFVED